MEKNKAKEGTRIATIFLGMWLFFTLPLTGVSGVLWWGELITAIVAIFFGLFYAPYIVALAGIWLEIAPLFFWAPSVAIYLNETMIGILLIATSLLIPLYKKDQQGSIPRNWSYNPSTIRRRLPVISFAFFAWMISRYLAAYQFGYIDTIWDPVFGDGTERVITSQISKLLPFPDAGLGALAYTFEVLLACTGGESRWRKMPWIVSSLAFLVGPVGIVSILLVISQPLIVGAWCFLCLLTAFAMAMMVYFILDEVKAVIQFLHQECKQGKSFWLTFLYGDYHS